MRYFKMNYWIFRINIYLRNKFQEIKFPNVFFYNFKLILSYLSVFLLFSTYTYADYAAVVKNPTSGYLIRLTSNNAKISDPVIGSDGKNYYRIGNPIIIQENASSVTISGTALCMGKKWAPNFQGLLEANNAFHRLFISIPELGIKIEGINAYRINNNVAVTIESKMTNKWVNMSAGACSTWLNQLTASVSDFTMQFPITVTFYINEKIIDNQIVIAGMDLGGYVRAYTAKRTTPPFSSWPIGESTAPMRLASSVLNVDSSCKTTTSTGQASTLNLKHGHLNSLNYDSLVTEKVTYNCTFSKSTDVRLRLDYATDGDPQKRLPMINATNNEDRIYSELKMVDESTGQSGTDFKVNIKDLKTITISSHLQGKNAVAGDYRGSAWLIATFD
ncbi:fimbrial adhesin [Providencia burhodogranariea DSM 19968]|uniref:Fimbrial adhesin n=2 Tax=Providencia burhodogranariea TaxID=516074 RepID=K8W4B3_9GAMM|nr:fimbrial adhesin [Providencia burhodogranariea DSM 19968]